MNSRRSHLLVLNVPVVINLLIVGLSIGMNSGCSQPAGTTLPSASTKPADSAANQSPPAKADDAVRRVLDGLQRRQARALWEFLPPSYRRDSQQLVRDVAERLDDKSWGPFVATWQKARRVLPHKLSALTPTKGAGGEHDLESNMPFNPAALTQLLEVIGDSELSDLQRMRSIELDRFLDHTGDKLLAALGRIASGDKKDSAGDPFARFGQVQVELVESANNTAVVKVRWPKQEPTTHSFVRVEDHWIPQPLAESWPSQFPVVRAQCLAWADSVREHPDEWHPRLSEINGLLDELAATKSAADARQVWQSGVTHLVVEWLSASPSTAANPAANSSDNPSPQKSARVKRPDTEVLLPDESEK